MQATVDVERLLPDVQPPHVELVTEPIDEITDDAVVTADGVARPVDTIILATGFETTKFLSAIEVTGRDGVPLDDAWADGAQAYLGITTAGFPNLFMLYGPNTNNGSILFMIEYQVGYVMRAPTHRRRGHRRDRRQARGEDDYNDAHRRTTSTGVEVWQAAVQQLLPRPRAGS